MVQLAAMQNREEVARKFGYTSWDRYARRASFLFDGLSLAGRRVCDVGCGAGAWAVWCASHGAEVIGLEPQAHGSSDAYFRSFMTTLQVTGLTERVQSCSFTMEEYLPTVDQKFDLLILHNVINHLAEDAVQCLPGDAGARELYVSKFKLMRGSLTDRGILLIADSARSNFWNRLGLRSPLARTIEWDKHQDPPVWVDLATQAGLALHDLRWSYIYPFRRLTANYMAQYLSASHFVLRFTREPDTELK